MMPGGWDGDCREGVRCETFVETILEIMVYDGEATSCDLYYLGNLDLGWSVKIKGRKRVGTRGGE